jgi:hypothetical protein
MDSALSSLPLAVLVAILSVCLLVPAFRSSILSSDDALEAYESGKALVAARQYHSSYS